MQAFSRFCIDTMLGSHMSLLQLQHLEGFNLAAAKARGSFVAAKLTLLLQNSPIFAATKKSGCCCKVDVCSCKHALCRDKVVQPQL